MVFENTHIRLVVLYRPLCALSAAQQPEEGQSKILESQGGAVAGEQESGEERQHSASVEETLNEKGNVTHENQQLR